MFKKGNKDFAVNYRPVSLTCICCKLLEHVIGLHIHEHLEQHNILTPVQHGFRKGHSYDMQLLITVHDLMLVRDKNKQVDMAVLDFSKSFNTVLH